MEKELISKQRKPNEKNWLERKKGCKVKKLRQFKNEFWVAEIEICV
jgi:hypothetical protein